jgi:NADPH-dependent 2,4-dienoyl-CoA reductase/sulfur reductase-like enzyme
VVVGAGPVGMTAAAALTEAGFRVTVFEAQPPDLRNQLDPTPNLLDDQQGVRGGRTPTSAGTQAEEQSTRIGATGVNRATRPPPQRSWLRPDLRPALNK